MADSRAAAPVSEADIGRAHTAYQIREGGEAARAAEIENARREIEAHLRFISVCENNIVARRRSITRWEARIATWGGESVTSPSRGAAAGDGALTLGGELEDAIGELEAAGNCPGRRLRSAIAAHTDAAVAAALAADRAARLSGVPDQRLLPMEDAPRKGGVEILVYDDHGYVSLVHKTLASGWTCINRGQITYDEDRDILHVGEQGPYEDGEPKAIGWLSIRPHPYLAVANGEVPVSATDRAKPSDGAVTLEEMAEAVFATDPERPAGITWTELLTRQAPFQHVADEIAAEYRTRAASLMSTDPRSIDTSARPVDGGDMGGENTGARD